MSDELAISSIELFAGVGMLGEGLRAGLRYLGFKNRTVCYVEREAYPAAVLASRMEEKSMDDAPIWSDVSTFDAAAWCGRVDCIVAGFPCQDLSIAGRRAGLDGKRSGLFFEVLRIAEGCGAWFLVLENVAGIATATASVVDEAEGALDERAAARVVGELADRGWDAEWINLSASDVGAGHGRARWFCVAWRMADATRHRRDRSLRQAGRGRGICETSFALVNAKVDGIRSGDMSSRTESKHSGVDGSGGSMDDAERTERWPECVCGTRCQQGDDGRRRETNCGAGIPSEALADAGSARLQGTELGRACDGNRGGGGNIWVN